MLSNRDGFICYFFFCKLLRTAPVAPSRHVVPCLEKNCLSIYTVQNSDLAQLSHKLWKKRVKHKEVALMCDGKNAECGFNSASSFLCNHEMYLPPDPRKI